MRALIPSIALLLLAGCGGGQSNDPEPGPTSAPVADNDEAAPETEADAPPAEEQADTAESLQAMMHTYVWRVIDARDLLVAGEMDSARSSLRRLVDEEPPTNLPGDWLDAIDDVRTVASRGASSDDSSTLAGAIGEASLLCGDCHAPTGGGPGLEFAEPPNLTDTLQAEMHRHVWASDRLWEGLVAPSDERWAAGVAAVYADSALTGPTMTGPSEIEWALTSTQAELTNASGTERAVFYGEFIAACSSCHTMLGAGPADIAE